MPSASSRYSARWGCLIPWASSTRGHTTIDLRTPNTSYVVGRDRSSCDIWFPWGSAISKRHCIIHWDGNETGSSEVTVEDISSNGTFINDVPVKSGNNNKKRLRDGSEISFGLANSARPHDNKFIFRQVNMSLDGVVGVERRYDLLSILGRGSFGTVALAADRASGRRFAVKMIRTGLACVEPNGQRSAYGQRVQREVEILRRLRHAHVCQLVGAFVGQKRLDLVLEYVPGGNLAEYMEKNGAIAESQTQVITAQICSALVYIHSQGVVHRDIKPANVLIHSHSPIFVKVADFGLAKAIEVGPHGTPQLQTQCGTPAYAAPEAGMGFYDYKVDSWSLGVMVYQMLSTFFPFFVGERNQTVDYKALASISDQGKHFIGELLQYHAIARMSSVEAIAHGWVQTGASEEVRLERERALGASPPGPHGLNGSGIGLQHDSSCSGSADTVIQYSRSGRGRVAQTLYAGKE